MGDPVEKPERHSGTYYYPGAFRYFIIYVYTTLHKCINNCAPHYLAESIKPLSDDPNRSRLRSSKSADVTIPRTKTKICDRAFWVADLEQSSWSYSGNQDPSRFQEAVKTPPSV